MTDNGWGFGWLLAAVGVGMYAGYRIIPWMQRVEETEKLVDLAERVCDLAVEEPHKIEAMEILQSVKKYREGVLAKTEAAEKHEGVIKQLKSKISFITKKIPGFSMNSKEKKREVEADLGTAA